MHCNFGRMSMSELVRFPIIFRGVALALTSLVNLQALPKVLANGNVQVVVLGTGKKTFEKMVKELDKKFPGAKGVVKFSAPLAHMITAGADFLLVPSRFEPCGLIQLHAMQYGTVPLVASTGGLVDTVKEGRTGFQMGAMNPDGLTPEDADAVAETIARAADVFGTPAFEEMVNNCIHQDLSWAEPAKKWEGVLEEVRTGYAMGSAKKLAVQVPVARV
jgi:granule-bound starch synthase